MFLIIATLGYAIAAAVAWRTGTRRGIAAACVLVLASVVTFSARADAAEDRTACTIEGVGVGLGWVATGLATETGPGAAVAAASAATATAAWAHGCPRTIAGLLGSPPPFVFTHSGCLTVRIARMREMPLRWCWSHVRTVREWKRIMRPRVAAYAAAAYMGKI